MKTRKDLCGWIVDALKELKGSAKIAQIREHIWENHKDDLINSGNLHFTWHEDIYWAATQLRAKGILKNAKATTKSVWTLVSIIACLILMFSCPSWADSFVPPSGKTLLLVGQDRETIAHYVSATGNIPGGVMLYSSVQKAEALETAADEGAGPEDGNALLKSYPNSVIQLGLYMVDTLDGTLAGKYDSHLKTLAQWIKKTNRPVYLRVGYEFDLPDNHYDPQKYKQAFRYVVDFLRKEGVHNAAYVWHSYIPQTPGWHWMDWYPGDDYVDWFGVSMFSTNQIPMASDFAKLAREHGKSFMICESTPEGLYSTQAKVDWFNHVFQFIKDQKVNIFCYIDTNWDAQKMWAGQNWGDQRVEKDSDIKNLWLNEIVNSRYLKASPDLFQRLGWKP